MASDPNADPNTEPVTPVKLRTAGTAESGRIDYARAR
jgi:hypothetical protein